MAECKSVKFKLDYRKFGKWNTRTPKERGGEKIVYMKDIDNLGQEIINQIIKKEILL